MIAQFPKYIHIEDSTIKTSILENVVRSEMEVGPQKTRAKESLTLMTYSFEIVFCKSKISNFLSWFQNDIKSGAFWFLMNDPLTGVNKRFRFIEYKLDFEKLGDFMKTTIVLESYADI